MPPPRPAACAWPACVQHACHEYIIARPDSSVVSVYAVYSFVITHRSTALPILISDLISKYNSLTLAPNMPCMLLVIIMCTYYVHRNLNYHPLQPGTQCIVSGHCHHHWQHGNRGEGPEDYIMGTATLDECRIYGANLSETYAFNERTFHTTHNEHCMDLRL